MGRRLAPLLVGVAMRQQLSRTAQVQATLRLGTTDPLLTRRGAFNRQIAMMLSAAHG